jgi:hypothetical protein
MGTWKDLEEERQVSTAEARGFAKSNGFQFIETSALTGENVAVAFGVLAKMCKKKKEQEGHIQPLHTTSRCVLA